MTDELSPKMKEVMEHLLPVIKKYLVDKANECFETDKEKMDFVLSCAVNLLGNMTMHAANDDLNALNILAHKTIQNLMIWFDMVIKLEQRKKETH